MSRLAGGVVSMALCLILMPADAAAQGSSAASLAGTVRDESGAVLPGVTVEASSPVLIERARATVSDQNGEYRITELRPGTYSVSFTLPGFSVFKRDGLELSANFTATVNAEMKVGAIEETITVSGQTPLIDVQNVAQQQVISKALIDAVPTAKSMLGIAALMPAVVTPPNAQDVGGTKGEQSVRISVHGGKTNDSRLLQDGMSYNNLAVEGTGRGYYVNPLMVQETVIDTGGGGNAQYALGGAIVNAIPRDGGSQFNGTFFGAWAGHQLQGDNFTQELKDKGLTSVNGVRKLYDVNALLGGPVVRDKLWAIGSIRRSGGANRVANLYHALDTNSFLFTPDLSRPVEPVEKLKTQNVRLTYQASSRDKFTFSYDLQRNIRDQLTGQLDRGTTAIEANGSYCTPDDMFQGTWNRPQSNRVLFEAGLTYHRGGYGANMGTNTFLSDYELCGDYLPDRVSINDTGLGFTYHGTGTRAKNNEHQINGRFSVSYVTGSHNFKTGMYLLRDIRVEGYSFRNPSDVSGLPLSYTFRNQAPTSLTQFVSPTYTTVRLRPDLGLFVQDQWRMIDRITVSAGLRYDYNRAYVPAIDRPAGVLVDAASLEATSCTPCWHDLNPRLGIAWDIWGDGKTAVKFGFNRYVQAATSGLANQFSPINSTVANTTRSWTDANRNFLPDCDLRSPLMNGECGPMANQTFGQTIITTRPDPDWIKGFQKRPYTWQMSASVDRQILPGLAVGFGFYRTWFGNFTVTDNLAVTPDDYSPYCVTAPTDARLGADISGQPICGLYDINLSKFGQVNNLVTSASSINPLTGQRYADPSEVYKGADVTFAARIRGMLMNGGWNIGNAIQTGLVAGGTTSSSTDNCYVIDSPQQLFRCKVNNPYQSRFKLSGSYPLPWDIQAAVVYQNLPSINYGAARSYANAEILPSLGRNLSGATAVTIQLIAPFTEFVDERINQFDGRFSKIIRAGGRKRIQANFDLYNLLNTSTVVGVNNTYSPTLPNGGTYLQPTQILDARMAKISIQFDF